MPQVDSRALNRPAGEVSDDVPTPQKPGRPAVPLPAGALDVDLDGWVLDSGQYPGFAVGQPAVFALEFSVEGALHRLPQAGPEALHELGDGRYLAHATVLHASPRATIIRAGPIDAYAWRGVPHDGDDLTAGDGVTGVARFGVDPFRYRDLLEGSLPAPSIRHTWQVDAIELWAAGRSRPVRSTEDRGVEVRYRLRVRLDEHG